LNSLSNQTTLQQRLLWIYLSINYISFRYIKMLGMTSQQNRSELETDQT